MRYNIKGFRFDTRGYINTKMEHIPPDRHDPTRWIPRIIPLQPPRMPMTDGSFFAQVYSAKTSAGYSSMHYDPNQIIAEFLFGEANMDEPRRRYPKSCASPYEDDIQKMCLRLVSKPFAKLTVTQIGIRIALTELCRNVREMPHEDVRGLVEILAGRHTRLLDLSYCADLTDAEVILSLKRCPLLRSFKCRGCAGISDTVFKELSMCRRLVSLQIGDCQRVSGRGLLRLLRSPRFPASCLQELRIPNFAFINDVLMDDILRAIGSGLRVLDVQGTKIGDASMRSIARYNRSMKCLIAGSNNISDEGIVALCGADSLSLLELDVGYNRITDTGVVSICHSFKSLNTLRICGMVSTNNLSLSRMFAYFVHRHLLQPK